MRKRRRKKRLIRLAIWVAVITSLLIFVYSAFLKQNNLVQSNILSLQEKPTANPLKESVDNALVGTKGTYSVVVKNLKTGESYAVGEDKVFLSGSLYKLWVMVTVFKQIQNGTLNEDEILSGDANELNQKFNISSEAAELTDVVISSSVRNALSQMITISHNYDALLLVEKIKLSSVASFLDENGFNQSKVGVKGEAPTTTASDIALFFEKLYQGQLADPERTNQMLELLKKQQLNKKIPRYLPEGTVVAHKTGELDFFSHDAGIVYLAQGDYIIVVLSESDAPPAAEERIAQISKNIYSYFQKKDT